MTKSSSPQIFGMLLLSALSLSSLILVAKAETDILNLKNKTFQDFERQKTASPPAAYLFAKLYLARFGIDQRGVELTKWTSAYEAVAPGIYSAHDEEFGLYSQNLNLLLHSAFWTNRGFSVSWAISPDAKTFVTILQRGRDARYWTRGGPDGIRWSFSTTPNLAIWDDGDWQSFDANGNPENLSSKRQYLKQALHRATDGTLPSGLFADAFGGWVIIWGKNQFQCSEETPPELCARLAEIRAKDQTIRQISFGDNGNWLILYGKNGAFWHGVPISLSNTWKAVVQQNKYIDAASIFPGGGWFIQVKPTH